MKETIHLFGIAGSLRTGSYNKALLHAATALVPENAKLTIFEDLDSIPLFNQDEEKTPPKAVKKLKEEITRADAILFATPEYNYSFPGVLKNAIDWASRPYGNSAWDGKPTAIMSASTGILGGSRAQYQLRQVFVFLNMFPLNKPEVIVSKVNEKVNDAGELTDAHTKEKIKELLQALVAWTERLQGEIILPRSTKENYPYDQHYSRMQS